MKEKEIRLSERVSSQALYEECVIGTLITEIFEWIIGAHGLSFFKYKRNSHGNISP